jgi:hypothetical protein
MDTTPEKDPHPIAFSVRIYRLLLALFPPAFRQEYGSDMLQVFRDSCVVTFQKGGLQALISLWSHALIDLGKSALAQNLDRKLPFTQNQWVRISRWCLLSGGISMAVAVQSIYLNAAGYAPHVSFRTLNQIQPYLLPGAWLLITLGIAGILSRYGNQAGRSGRALLRLSLLGGASAVISSGAVLAFGWAPWWSLGWMTGNILLFTCLALFGLLASRLNGVWGNPLPAWSRILLILSLAFPFLGLFAWAGLFWGQAVTWSAAAGLALLGYSLHSSDEAGSSRSTG